MKKALKRGLATVLALIISVGTIPYVLTNVKAASNIIINGVDIGYADGDYFTKNGKSCANSYWASGRCHHHDICEDSSHSQCNCMRYWPTGKKSTCEVDLSASQCFGFARYCQYVLYGCYDLTKPSSFTDITGTIYKENCTANTLKSKLLNCPPATHVRTLGSGKGYEHSISIVSTSEYGANVADCNSDGYCKVRSKTYSWAELASYLKSYGGVDYANAWNKDLPLTRTLKVYFNANGGSINSDTYKLSNNLVYNKNDGSKKYQPWTYNNAKTNGLVNCGTLGLYKTGYTFVGWGTSASGGTVFDQDDASLLPTAINANVANGNCSTTLYAIWEPNILNVYFNANGGSLNSDTYKLTNNLVCNVSDGSKKYQPWVYNNKKTNGLVNYTTFGLYKTGYTFAGWGTSASGGTIHDQNDASLLPTDINPDVVDGDCSTTLYAIWEPNVLNVYFNANGGSIDSDTYKLSNNLVCNISDGSKKYQPWTYNNAKTNGLVNYGTLGLYKTGYTFVGWGTSSDGGTIFSQGDADLLPTSINSNLKNGDCSTTLYAIWEPNTLDVYFNANGGNVVSEKFTLSNDNFYYISDGSKFVQTWTYNNKKTNGLPNYSAFGLSRKGYTFVGWGTSSDGGTIFSQSDVDLLPTSINSNIISGDCSTTVYAIWEIKTYSVNFDANGGTGAPLTQTKICGEDLVLSSVNPTREGYVFLGWSQNADDVNATYVSGATYSSNASCTLYAIWKSEDEIHSYTIEKIITEPTCTTSGLKKICCSAHSDCGMYKEVEIPATGHTYGDWEIVSYSTCMTSGSKTQKCVCGDTLTESIEVLEHNYSEEWTVDKEVICTEDGSKSHHCITEGCAEKTDVTVISATGHDYSEWTITKYATCVELGSREKSCGCGDVYTEEIPLSDCNYSTVWTIDKEATCTEDGSKSYHCLVCDNKEDVTVISATGHNYVFNNALNVHPHTITYMCTCCGDKKIETPIYNTCVECNFTVTLIDSTEYKLVSYIGTETGIVIPSYHEGLAVTTIANSCFKGNTEITSVEIAEGVTTIGSLAFMNCTSLEKVVIPASVTSIGAQAFYGFTGTIYCTSGSVAHEYAIANNIKYVLMHIMETENTKIDYENFMIFTNVQNSRDITEVLGIYETAVAIPTASYIHGNLELYGTGTVITVFDGNEYVGDFTLVVEGDTNGDSVCDALDAWQVGLVSNGHRTLDGAYALAADSNSDDIVDATDYQSIVNKAVS